MWEQTQFMVAIEPGDGVFWCIAEHTEAQVDRRAASRRLVRYPTLYGAHAVTTCGPGNRCLT